MKKGLLEVLNTIAQLVMAGATVFALFKIVDQTRLSSEQLKLQRETSDRTWAAELLTAVYENATPQHVRAEAVRAYILLQRDLKGQVRLPRANLQDMDLVDDDKFLARADLESAEMRGIILESAKLQNAVLAGANLGSASLRGADLSDANLSQAQLYMTDLSGSTLVNVNFEGAEFNQQDAGTGRRVGGANARGANFSGARFDEYTKFCRVDISGAKLRDAKGLTQNHLSCVITDSETTLPHGLHAPRPGECVCLDDVTKQDTT
jgi:hypothetical protein